jgi:hypothetical protein
MNVTALFIHIHFGLLRLSRRAVIEFVTLIRWCIVALCTISVDHLAYPGPFPQETTWEVGNKKSTVLATGLRGRYSCR